MNLPQLNIQKKPLVVWAGDLHINHTMALCPPVVLLDDGESRHASKAQGALWEAWQDAWLNIKRRKREVVLVLGGEVTENNNAHGRTVSQLISHNPESIQDMAMEALDPAISLASKVLVLRGTEAHVGPAANLDERIAKAVAEEKEVIRHPDNLTYSWWWTLTNIGGLSFDLAHHVSMGGRPWSEKNAANFLAAQLIMDYADMNEPLPDFAVRGHVHRVSDSSFNYRVRAITAPCWKLADAYVHRLGAGHRRPHIGVLIFDTKTKEVELLRYETEHQKPVYIR